MIARPVLVLVPLLLALAPGPARADWAVGHRSVTYQDPARGNRSIPVEIYYPAEGAGDDVPVAPGEFPIYVFGHGYLLTWDLYSFVWNGLVPNGFLVALPKTEGSLFPSHGEFGEDLAFLVAKLRSAGGDPGSPLYGHVAETAAIGGHSMGGGASFLAAAEDPTIDAIANLAAAETNPSAIGAASDVAIPALLFAGGNDCVTPPEGHQLPMYDALASDCKTCVEIAGASHCQFAAYSFPCAFGEGSCADPTISRSAQQATVLDYLLPWLRYELEGDLPSWAAFQELLASDDRTTFLQECAITAVAGGEAAPPPPRLALAVRPNPFNPIASLSIAVPRPGPLRVVVFDSRGRAVSRILEETVGAGTIEASWNGTDDRGMALPSGAYFLRASAAGASSVARAVLVR